MTLNHIQITNAKPRAKVYKLTDSGGLYLVVQPNEAKLWRMNYRCLGQQKTLYFGAWPEAGIAAARQKRDKARKEMNPAGIERLGPADVVNGKSQPAASRLIACSQRRRGVQPGTRAPPAR